MSKPYILKHQHTLHKCKVPGENVSQIIGRTFSLFVIITIESSCLVFRKHIKKIRLFSFQSLWP